MTQQTTGELFIATPTDLDLVLTRTFNAPAAAVFDAWTKCEHFSKWYGPSGWTVPACVMDLRPGGRWRVTMRSPDGAMEMSQGGEYRQVDRPESVTFTEAPEGPMLDMVGETIVTLAFDERDGRTIMTRSTRFESSEKRDAMLNSGASSGWAQSFLRLDQHLTAGDS